MLHLGDRGIVNRFQMEVVNQQLISDQSSVLPNVELPRGLFTALNRFRAGAGPCHGDLYSAASPLCDCGEAHTMDHVVNRCGLTALEGGLTALNDCTDKAIQWLKDLRDSIR